MIYVIIPTFNEKKFISGIVESFNQQSYQDYKIIISDNSSTDGTIEEIPKLFPQIELIINDDSFWWTKSTNSGIRYALNLAGDDDFILTLNCDTIIKNNYLENLLICHKKNNENIIGSLTVDKENDQIKFGGLLVNKFTAKYNRINYNKIYSTLQHLDFIPTDTLPGRGILIPIKILKKVGLFDEMLPQYFADYEFGFRCSSKGYPCIVCYQAPVYSYTKNTGLNNELRSITNYELLKSFFTRRSPNFLYRRIIYIYKSFGIKFFLIHLPLDFLRLIVGSSLRQFRNQK